jgi:hypothetical protein
MRVNSVEIKISVDRPQVKAALEGFGPMGDPRARSVYFCEDVTAAVTAGTPLLDAQVILRVRSTEGAPDDCTVKLRPCRQTQLTGKWLDAAKGHDAKLKAEADWAGTRRVLAVSYTRDLPGGLLGEVLEGGESVGRLFSDDQQRFLADCGAIRVNLDSVTVLPPITATRWGPFRTAPPDPTLKIMAERWTVGDELDFLELSIQAAPRDAGREQALFEELVRSRGLDVDAGQETKTRRVLGYLIDRVA